MTIRQNKFPIEDLIVPKNVLLSVYYKDNLPVLINGILEVNPEVIFYSTGGTGKAVKSIVGEFSKNYISVEDFTKFPEMEGGLVKTLHPKIHGGLLGERGNPEHEKFLYDIINKLTGSRGVYFDVMVGNLYPFQEKIKEEGVSVEDARINIDIGGPTMVMASAKNWHSVAVLTAIGQYEGFVKSLKENGGVSLKERFKLAKQAMREIAEYRTANADYFESLDFEKDVKPTLNIKK
ncbi:Bifunctional purine biosynthesis protein PurH [Candidatus Tiddalikarchaeum anstoanum]|nr:Bifunctional purine biosynthesis protein PurH [Candidatus Tiddalikarchaeum anstoanum]